MKFNCAYTKLVDLAELQPNPNNPNQHPEKQIEMLSKIINYQGQRSPIVVSKRSGFITKGHGRLLAIQKLGWAQAAVDFQDYENEAQEYADMVADNKIAELAEHDDDKMVELIKSTDIDDLELFGLDDFELPKDDEERREEIEDEVPDVDRSITKLGDFYELGSHFLLCGDSTDKSAVEKLMNGEKADMVFTDPPYGMNLDTDYSGMKGWHQGKEYKRVAGDASDFDPKFIEMSLSIGCKETYLWGADYYAELLPDKNSGSWLVWDKRVDESKDKMYGSGFELCWSRNKHQRRIIRKQWAGFMGDAEARDRMHPTQKPTELIKYIFDEWCNGLMSVLDLFGGSGSTLIACEKTNRKCFMMELDPHYVDVIVTRWCKYTGQTEIKRNGQPMTWTVGQQ